MVPPNPSTVRQLLNNNSQGTSVFNSSSSSSNSSEHNIDDDEDDNNNNNGTISHPATIPSTKLSRTCCCCCTTMSFFLSRIKGILATILTRRKPDNEENDMIKNATATEIQTPGTPVHRRHRAIETPGRSGYALVLDGLTDALASEETSNDDYDVHIERSNDVRSRFRKETIRKDDLKFVKRTLEEVMDTEQSTKEGLSMKIIRDAHLDGMTGEILRAVEKLNALVQQDDDSREADPLWIDLRELGEATIETTQQLEMKELIHGILSNAAGLEKIWREKHGDQWLAIDNERMEEVKKGVLRDVHLSITSGYRGDEEEMWKVDNVRKIAGIGGAICFKPGDFWPLIWCAYRDGIVNSVEEVVTTGDWGPTALPMLTGTETLSILNHNLSVFVHRGSDWNIHCSLMATNSKLVRVMRGHELNSPLAPSKGFRYDGLYTVKRWGMKGPGSGHKYELQIELERYPGQTPMDEVRLIPTPAQEDIWELCQKMIAAKKRAGQASSSEQAGPISTGLGSELETSTTY